MSVQDSRLEIRLSKEEKEHLIVMAKEHCLSLSDYVRRKLLYALPLYYSEEKTGFVEMAKEIEKIASEEKEAAPVKVEKKQNVCPRCVRLNAGKPLSGCRACLSGGS